MYPLPQGFRTAGLHCGVKSDPDVFDLALFVSDRPASAAGVFTQNRVCGAPVKVSRARVPRATGRAVVINSGNANACTGERGIEDARTMCETLATALGCEAEDVLVCSTGVIGHFLPIDNITGGIRTAVEALASTPDAGDRAALGMMTTDTVPKQSVREVDVDGTTVRVTGFCKGAAMIAPNMATMLAVVLTDAELDRDVADAVLRHAVDRSFNCISVEGHTSTSDSVLMLANGSAGTGRLHDDGLSRLQTAVDEVCAELAQMIVRDAEGAEHFVTIDVRGARTREDAHRIARLIADSPLVKTGITGNDPNWGRIVSVAGYSGVDLREEDVSLDLNGTPVYRSGTPVEHDEAAVSRSMATGEVHIELRLSHGEADVRFWTCDLTEEYVRLNSEYTT